MSSSDRKIRSPRAEDTLQQVLYKARIRRAMGSWPAGERQHRVIERMLNDFPGPMTSSKYAQIAKCSTDTALRDIQALVAHGILHPNPAGGRSSSYRLPDREEVPPENGPDSSPVSVAE